MENATPIIIGFSLSALSYPLTFAKTLCQIGYEPKPPVLSSGLFGGTVYLYPNMFKYAGHIYNVDGFFGLYRGFLPRLLSNTMSKMIVNSVHEHLVGKPLNEIIGDVEDQECENDSIENVEKLMKDTAYETISRCAGVIVSQPLYVISIRAISQFIGRETEYSTILSSISAIWKNEGLLGYFSGLIPRLLGEMFTIWIANILSYSIHLFIFQVNKKRESKTFVSIFANLIASQITYPFSLVSVVLSVNTSGLSAGSPPIMPAYDNWIQCMSSLTNQNELKRGSSLFWRRYNGPSLYATSKSPFIMPPIQRL